MVTKLMSNYVRLACQFIGDNRNQFNLRTMCRVLNVAPSGYSEDSNLGSSPGQ